MDEIPLSVLFGALSLLIVFSAFFSSSETAMIALNRYRLRHLVKEGKRSAIISEKLLERPDRLIGLILLGLGFGFLAYGSMSIPYGAQTASVSIFWLVFAYLFHTLGELCVSPVGLSYVSKLAPVRLVGLMFGFWLLSSFFANLIGGFTGSYICLLYTSDAADE